MNTHENLVYPEAETDLRRYILLLIRNWPLILLLAAISAVAALCVSFLTKPTYEATVYLATTKLKVDVQMGSQIETLSEEELGASAQIDRKSRLEGFAALAQNAAIAEEVLPQFYDRLSEIDENLTNIAVFLENHVSGEVPSKTDIIAITIQLQDPQLAAEIANAWGKAYERLVNQLYGGAAGQDVQAVTSQTQESFQDYQAAQSALEDYLANNPIPELRRKIELRQGQIASLQEALKEGTALVSGRELAARRQLLAGYYQDLVDLEMMLGDAQALERQVASGQLSPAGSFGDSLALIFLRSRAYAGLNEELQAPFEMQLQTPLSLFPGSVTAADIRALIGVLQQRLVDTDEKIEALTGVLLDPSSNQLAEGAGSEIQRRIETLTTEMQAFQAQLEAESSLQQDLERQRDLTWDTYSTLAKKQMEVRVAAKTGGTEVRMANSAVPPSKATRPKKLQNTMLAGVVGLMLGGMAVFLIDYLTPREENGRSVEGTE